MFSAKFINIALKSTAIVLVCFISAFSKTLIEQIGWKGADTGIIFGLTLAMVSGFGVLIGFHIKTRTKVQTDQRELEDELFQEYVQKSELNSNEETRLKELLLNANTTHSHVIFQSAALFEKCIDQEIQILFQKDLSQDELDDEEVVLGSLRKKLGYNYLPLEHPLISTRNLEIGPKLSVFSQNNHLLLIQNARVVQNREFYFRIQFDPEKEDMVRLQQGETVKLGFARQNDGVYGILVTIYRNNNASTIDFFHSMDLRRNQLRQYVRVDIGLPLKFRVIKTESEDTRNAFAGKLLETRMADISGGGLSFIYNKPLVPGDIVSLNFQLSTSPFAGISGKILRVSLQEGKSDTFYRHHVQFVNFEQRNREKIIRYVFEKQRQINQWR